MKKYNIYSFLSMFFLIAALPTQQLFSNEIIETHLYDNRVNTSISIKKAKIESPNLYEKTDKFRFIYQLQRLNDVKRISFIEVNEDYSFSKLLNTEINLRIRDSYFQFR